MTDGQGTQQKCRSLPAALQGILSHFKMGSTGPAARFKQIQQFKPDYSPSKITQYESERTGMRVVVVDQKGPKLHGFFILATEIHDDSGAPHTLEHLCFMGSKNYKYKGFLDKLATRAYSGTNAWTATDHTAYTLETAGWAGFAQILPVYLDHLILPTITDAACVTEVHHIDGEGNDAGVVYSEMQAVENTASELMELRSKRIIYEDGIGFRYETGGMMEPLRILSPDRIRDFHREMYQPKNLCLALFGEVDHDELLQILDQFETSVLPDIPDPEKPFKRPWMESKQAHGLSKTIVEKVEFPEEDESMGQIDIHYLGPDCSDSLAVAALNVVLLYLCGSSAAVLDNNLVEREQLASGILFNVDSRPRTQVSFGLSGVETEQLVDVERRFHEVLNEAMSQPLDMPFMEDCIERQVRSAKFNSETAATAFADFVIADYLFGKRDGSTLNDLSTLDVYEVKVAGWTEEQWKSFIKQYFSDAHYVSILGVPSAVLAEKIKTEEADRLEKQKEKLGPGGLKKEGEKLEQAKEENDLPIPEELLGHFKVPPTDSIHFVSTPSARSGPALKIGRPQNKYQKIVEADSHNSPLFIDFEHIPSNFARVSLVIGTENLPLELRPFLSIYFEAFFNLPLKRGNTTVPFDQVVIELERDTVGYALDSGGSLGAIETLRISFSVEIAKYHVAIQWIRSLLFDSIFDVERLKAITARLLADIPDAKRDGSDMLAGVHVMTHLSPESIGRARSTLTKALFLRHVKHLLKTTPDAVAQHLETLRSHLTQFPNFRVLVIADLEKLSHPVSAWSTLLSDLDTTKPLIPLPKRIDRLSPAGLHPGQLCHIIPMSTIDSSFLFAVARGPTSYTDPSLPAIMVAAAYLNAVEGPLWVAVRGVGLAYGVNIGYDIDSGFLTLDIYRSPDAWKAFDAAKKVIQAHIDGTIAFDALMVEGAISSIVVSFANEQATLANAAAAQFVKVVMRGLSEEYNQEVLRKVREVSVEEMKGVMRGVLFDVFRPGKADVITTCAGGLQEVCAFTMWEMGLMLTVCYSLSRLDLHRRASSRRCVSWLTFRMITDGKEERLMLWRVMRTMRWRMAKMRSRMLQTCRGVRTISNRTTSSTVPHG